MWSSVIGDIIRITYTIITMILFIIVIGFDFNLL